MQSLRDRQILEVLDEDRNINRQVFDREKQQVKVFQENILPKKTRDLEAETSVDKLVENINRIVENKLTSLEYLLSKIVSTKDIGDAEGRRSYNNVVSNGDIITNYNQLIRVYTVEGISRASQELIKVKLQDIKPNIDAIIYGIEQLVQYLFEAGKSDKEIFQLIRSQAVFQIIQDQLFRTNSYKTIEQGDIQVAIKEVLSELSDVQRAELRDISGRDITEKSLLKLPIEIGDDEARIQQLEAELGFNLPRGATSEFAPREKEQAFSMFGDLGKEMIVRNRQEFDQAVRQLSEQRDTLQNNLKRVSADFRREKRDLARVMAQREQLLQGQPNYRQDDDLKDADFEAEVPLSEDIVERQKRIKELQSLIGNLQQNLLDTIEQLQTIKQNFEVGLKEKLDKGIARELGEIELPLKKKGVRSLVPENAEFNLEGAVDVERLSKMSDSELRTVAFNLNYTPLTKTKKETIIATILKKIADRRMRGQGRIYNDTERHLKDYGSIPSEGFDDRRDDIYYIQRQLKRDY